MSLTSFFNLQSTFAKAFVVTLLYVCSASALFSYLELGEISAKGLSYGVFRSVLFSIVMLMFAAVTTPFWLFVRLVMAMTSTTSLIMLLAYMNELGIPLGLEKFIMDADRFLIPYLATFCASLLVAFFITHGAKK